MELYNEEIIDLFDQSGSSSNKMTNSSIHVGGVGKRSSSSNTQSGGIRIHEDVNGNIYTVCDKSPLISKANIDASTLV